MGVHYRHRIIAIVGLMAVAASGCANWKKASAAQQPTARITIEGTTRSTHDVKCTQIQWWLTVDVTAAPGQAQAILRIDSGKPVVSTVTIGNFDGFSGVAGEDVGHAEATFANGVYTITGDAVGAVPDHPDQSKTVPFRIEVPC